MYWFFSIKKILISYVRSRNAEFFSIAKRKIHKDHNPLAPLALGGGHPNFAIVLELSSAFFQENREDSSFNSKRASRIFLQICVIGFVIVKGTSKIVRSTESTVSCNPELSRNILQLPLILHFFPFAATSSFSALLFFDSSVLLERELQPIWGPPKNSSWHPSPPWIT